MRRLLAVLAVLVGAVLGCGYWHQQTHATLSITVRDASQPRSYRGLPNVRLRLLDGNGSERAQASSGDDGVIALTAPQAFACRDAEQQATRSAEGREAWQHCFAAQSRFLADWVDRLSAADVAVGNCRLRAPLRVDRYSDDWWLWWVPLPHVGGKPYRHYSVSLVVDAADCSVVKSR